MGNNKNRKMLKAALWAANLVQDHNPVCGDVDIPANSYVHFQAGVFNGLNNKLTVRDSMVKCSGDDNPMTYELGRFVENRTFADWNVEDVDKHFDIYYNNIYSDAFMCLDQGT